MNKTMQGWLLLASALLGVLWLGQSFPSNVVRAQAKSPIPPEQAAHIEAGNTQFQQKCAFCHGRDAGGGETGPDLTRSKLVLADVNGDKIGDVVRNGRAGRMPPFTVSDAELSDLVAFVHE